MDKGRVRRILFIIASALCWYFSVGYSHEIFQILIDREFIKPEKNIVIDGADFTPFINLVVTGTNSLISFIIIGSYILITTLFVALIAIILRVTTIRKTDIVTQSEVKFTRNFIIISSFLAFVAGVLVSHIRLADDVFLLSWQQPLFMFLIYYLALRKRAKENS